MDSFMDMINKNVLDSTDVSEYLISIWKTILSVALCGYFFFYCVRIAKKPAVHTGNCQLRRFLERHCPVLGERFWPTLWCWHGHAQTILAHLLRQTYTPPPYERELLSTHDGGEICLDWSDTTVLDGDALIGETSSDRATIIFLPGLTGCSKDAYISKLVARANYVGYRCVVFNYRGMGGSNLKTAKTYSAANTEDMKEVVRHVKQKYPDSPLMAVGASLGGMITYNFVAREGLDCGLVGAMTISVAWDPFKSTVTLETPLNRMLFNWTLTCSLLQLVKGYRTLFEPVVDVEETLKSRTIREFDSSFTAKIFGYKDLDDYYSAVCLHTKIDQIKIPVLCLNAKDDPFSPVHGLPIGEIERSEQSGVMLVLTTCGGHIAFLQGFIPQVSTYIEKVFIQYAVGLFTDRESISTAFKH